MVILEISGKTTKLSFIIRAETACFKLKYYHGVSWRMQVGKGCSLYTTTCAGYSRLQQCALQTVSLNSVPYMQLSNLANPISSWNRLIFSLLLLYSLSLHAQVAGRLRSYSENIVELKAMCRAVFHNLRAIALPTINIQALCSSF